MDTSIPAIHNSRSEWLAFVGLVLGVSWLAFLPDVFTTYTSIHLPEAFGSVVEVLTILSPLLAAIVVIIGWRGSRAATRFVRTRLRWRVSPRWYAIALVLIPLLFSLPLLVFVWWSGHPFTIDDGAWLLVIDVFTLGIIANLLENYGWRGYLQEALQSRYPVFVACVGVGVVWGLWHAAVFLPPNAPLSGLPYRWYFLALVGLALLFGWIYNATGGSVAVVTALHCSQNATTVVVLFSFMEAGIDVTPLVALYAVTIWIAVGVLYGGIDRGLVGHRQRLPRA